MVFSALPHTPGPYLFRTYKNEPEPGDGFEPEYGGPPEDCQIWEAARATSAAPGYLKSIKIKKRVLVDNIQVVQNPAYIDGAMACNDPTYDLMKEIKVHRRWRPGQPWEDLGIKLVLTLGTGLKPTTKVKARGLAATYAGELSSTVKAHILRPGRTEKKMRKHANRHGFDYFKWDGGLQIEAVSLDDCKPKTFKRMSEWTHDYMSRPEIVGKPGMEKGGELWKVAISLVEERRKRLLKTEREWARYASCNTYKCPLGPCAERPNLFNSEQEVEGHVVDHHPSINGLRGLCSVVPPCLRGPWCHETPTSEEP